MELLERVNGWVGEQLATATGVSSVGFLFLGGVLASLLPCVYPLYPITVAFLRARAEGGGPRYVHPGAYYLGLGTTYALFGIIAAATGGAFNDLMRLPTANLLIGLFLFVLALSALGVLHFPLLSPKATESRPGVGWTFVMGGGAALLSSACVGPIVVSVLVALAASTASVNAGTVVLAASKMLAFGLGVGLPLLLIGVFGVVLPRGGRWMVVIQWAFGLLIAYFALGYVNKALSGFGFSGEVGKSLLVGAALVAGATYLLQDAEHPVSVRTKKALLVLTAATGFCVMARHLLPAAAASTGAAATATKAVESAGNLTWYLDKEAAYEAAAQRGKPVFVDFHADWCTNCQAFQKRTQVDEALNAALSGAVLLKVYDTSPLFQSYKDDPRFPELRVGLPFFIITDARGGLIYKTSDFTRTQEMVLFLEN